MTIADVSEDILTGPYDQELRDELRRQLDALGVELRLGSALTNLPSAPPATLAPIRVATEDGGELVADIWFRAFGVRPHSEYLDGGSLEHGERATSAWTSTCASPGRPRSSLSATSPTPTATWRASPPLRPASSRRTYGALITGTGELTSWDTFPPLIAIPLGPEGGAGFIGDGVADSATIAELKGRHMIIDNYAVALRRRAGRGGLRLARRPGRSPCSWMGSNTHGGGRSAVAS